MPKFERSSNLRSFLIEPFGSSQPAFIRERARKFQEYVDLVRQHFHLFFEHKALSAYLDASGIGDQKKFGTLVATDVSKKRTVERSFQADQEIIQMLFDKIDPKKIRRGQLEALRVVRQLVDMGYKVFIRDYQRKDRKPFVRAAKRSGATVILATEGNRLDFEDHQERGDFRWARDLHVKIGNDIVRTSTSSESIARGTVSYFGEGGAMIEVAPKKWLVSDHIYSDPKRVKFEKKGQHQFLKMPGGFYYDHTLSHFLGHPVFVPNLHIDFNLGGIPENNVLAVCPNYLSEFPAQVEAAKKKFDLKVVEVPIEEAIRHPANFLPLGNGRVLVDSGAPKFIQNLKNAGVDVIPTSVPLNSLLAMRGSLHCLFNEF